MKKKILSLIITILVLLNTQVSVVLAQGNDSLGTLECIGGFCPDDLTEANVGAEGGASDKVSTVFSNAIGFMTIVTGIFFMLYFVIGAMSWVTSGGEQQKLEAARKKMTNGAIGMAITIGAYSMIFILGQVLGFDILRIGDQIAKLGPGGQ